MLTFEDLVKKIRKELRDNYQAVGDSMIAGNAKDYEQYKYLLGQAHAYQSMDQALTDILSEKKEKKDERKADNIIEFERSSED